MSGPWEEYQQADGPWAEYQEPQAATSGVNMEQARGRSLPSTWDVDIGGQQIRGVLDPDAKAYLVSDRMGQAYYINKNADGSLGLKPYTGKMSAAGTGSENFWAGAGKAAVDAKRGIKQLGALAGNTLGIVDDATVDEAMGDAQDSRARDADLMDTGAGLAGNIAGNVALVAAGGGVARGAGKVAGDAATKAAASAPNAARALQAAGNVASKAGTALKSPQSFKQAGYAGAAFGATQPFVDLKEKGVQVGIGGAAGVLGQGVANVVGSAARGAQSIRQEVKDLAQVARNKWGINIRNDQLLDSPKLNAVASVLDETPLTGMAAAKENQQKQFNIALAKTIGETSDNPLYAMSQAQKRLSGAFEDTLSNNRVLVDDEFVGSMEEVVRQANKNLKESEARIIRNQVDDILSKVSDDGRIDGKALYNIKKDLDQIGKRNSNEAIHATDLKRSLIDALNRSLGPDEAAKFRDVRTQYKNLLDLQKLKNRDAAGDISPARLGTARGELTDDLEELAAIAQTFLRPRVGNSGTAARLRADTNILNLPVRVGEAVGGATVGRAANAALNSLKFGKALLEGSSKAKKLEPIARVAPSSLPAFLESYLMTSP